MTASADADSFYEVAQQHARVGEVAEAVVAFSAVLQLAPNHLKARVGRGLALQRHGEHKAAVDDFSQAVQQAPVWPGIYTAYYGRACSQRALGELEAAVEDAGRAIESNLKHVDAYYLRGTMLKELSQTDRAVDDLNVVLRDDPTYYEAYYVRGTLFHLQKQWQEAVDDFSSCLRYAPASEEIVIECHRLRGVAACELGQYEAALVDLSHAVEADPADATNYFKRSQVYRAMGDDQRADADVAKATALRSET